MIDHDALECSVDEFLHSTTVASELVRLHCVRDALIVFEINAKMYVHVNQLVTIQKSDRSPQKERVALVCVHW